MRVKLINDFHGTEVRLNAQRGVWLSANQVKKAKKVLCGIKGCTCSNEAGQRGCKVNLMFYQDGSARVIKRARGE